MTLIKVVPRSKGTTVEKPEDPKKPELLTTSHIKKRQKGTKEKGQRETKE